MTEDAAPGTDGEVAARHKIVAGAALAAALAGGGISTLDIPWWNLRDHPTRPSAPAVESMHASATEQAPAIAAAAPTAPAATHPQVDAKPKRRRPKPETRPMPTTAPTPIARSDATIDAQYEATTALQCTKGISGFFCRETIRWRLCNGRWSDGVQPGASRCHIEKRETAGR